MPSCSKVQVDFRKKQDLLYSSYFAAAFFLPPPLAFLITPPRTMQKRSFSAATNSGVILHTCFLAARRSNSRRDTISDAANEQD
jgi:hypothetical protein